MKIVSTKKVDKETGFRTAFVTTRKIIDGNADPNGNRFYVMIRDLKAVDEFSGSSRGLAVRYIKTGPNLEPISKGLWRLPRDSKFAEDPYLESLKSKNQDWQIVDELAQDLRTNHNTYKSRIFIDKDQYEKGAKQ
jgi:hypothetical protein